MNELIRSALFVPAHREGWVEKALRASPDAVILDLEDAVPGEQKDAARKLLGGALGLLAAGETSAIVRPNAFESGETEADLDACVIDGIDALLLPKVDSAGDVAHFVQAVASLEQQRGLPSGGIAFVITLESASGYLNAAELARSPRVAGIFAATGKGGDVQRELGYRPTPAGLETLYYRSHAILAARAARLPHVLAGPWQDLEDLDGLRSHAGFNRDLGFTGEVLIHPSGVGTVNEIYAPSAAELEYHLGLVAAYEAAVERGIGAVDFGGDHVDAAHYRTSLAFVERARRQQAGEGG